MKTTALSVAAFAAALFLAPSPGLADGWGSVKGKFVLDGELPESEPLVKEGDAGAKDAEVCAEEDVPDDSLVVDPDSKAVANVVLFPSRFSGDIHPEAAKRPDTVTFDQKGCQFIPHVMVVQAGQTVLVKSDDSCAHNARGQFVRNQSFNITVPPNEREGIGVDITTGEPLPMTIKCDIHPYMSAHWVIVDHPYAAVSGEDGTFEIRNLPEGKHTFRIWHERKGYLDRSFKFEVTDGETTDVGTIKVDADDVKK